MSNMPKAKDFGGIDPNVKIPPAVLRHAAASEELHKQVYTKIEDAPVIEAKEPVVTPEVTPVAEKQQAPKVAPQVTPEVTPAQTPPKEIDDRQWEHRYNSMKGRWDASQSQVRDLAARVMQLEGLLAQANQKPRQPEQDPVERFITDKEVADYGADLLDVVGKKAKETFSPEVRALREQVAQLQARLEGVNQHVTGNARQQLLQFMDQNCPRWLEINDNPDFVAWLGLTDIMSGRNRHVLLKEAFEQNDAPRLLAFFKGFLAEEAALAPAPAQQTEHPAPSAPKVSLTELAAPGRAKSAAATGSTPAEKPIFTTKQITAFYTDVANGKYRGKEDEKNRREAQIFAAQAEGRIRDA